ncbi:hypothetical protein SAMN04487928_11013 [Butyrivibrio proteoclasticus]|uniref:DUF5722 domain-containing protein n=1 Tax=Butyrivibrio proteoclasticus TaxID=43305 RepID=A0A1I5TVI5_9FIRM|nr:DUF5722 domain-containing protein [Butyrivibrio proteoclasticus]SFP86326.1 hypothetical protein SAMN04487928_11013 [Butyrivibrio proteoclasticus]
MRKGSFFKKVMGVALTAATIFVAASSYSLVTNNEGVVAQAAGRVVSIGSCTIQGDQVVVNVSASTLPSSDDGKYYLYADEVYQDGTVGKVVATTERAGNATFTFPLNFYSAESNLSKKFLVAVKSGGSMVQVSDEHYITNPEAIATKTVARNDHGMKGILPNSADEATFKDLGIAQMVYNLYMGDIVGPGDGSNVVNFSYNGVDYQFNGAALAQYDGFVRWCSINNFQLTMTILNNKTEAGADLIHPLSRDAHVCPGYAMNTKEDSGTQHLKAIAAFLAQRYSGGAYGTVDNWVIGNEVNARTEWYYMNSTNLELNVSEYVKAFRIFYNEIKAVNGNARVYTSFDQEWCRKSNPGCFMSKEYLDRFNYYINREGNVDWSLSVHPYNAPLFDPYAWKQQSQYVSPSLNTPYITMENIYILTDYMCQASFLSPSGKVRNISLSEIGFTSSFGEDAQAASLTYAYTMAENNPYISSFILFRETDNAHEIESHIAQGLKNLDGSKKMSYDFYKYLGTAQAATYKAQASQIIGQDVDALVTNRTFLSRKGWFLND